MILQLVNSLIIYSLSINRL